MQLAWFYLPVAMANMAPVFMQHHLQFLAVPVDFGAQVSGKPLFGDHKTWRGLIAGTVFGGLTFIVQFLLTIEYSHIATWAPFDITTGPWWFGLLFGAAAITGDLFKSFFKRRFDFAPGDTWFPFDQIDFLILSTLAASFFYPITATMIVLVFSVGVIAHIIVNHIGYYLKMKDTPW